MDRSRSCGVDRDSDWFVIIALQRVNAIRIASLPYCPITSKCLIHKLIFLWAKIVERKTRPIVGTENRHSSRSDGKEVMATQLRNFWTKMRHSLPSTHERESVGEIIDEQCY